LLLIFLSDTLLAMQLEALQVFCDVVRYRSFSQAAAMNHVTQSAASQIVIQLEKRLGVRLIDRSTRPPQPTSAGREYYDGCKAILDQYQELEASIRKSQIHLAATVQVAAIYSVGLGDMGQYVERFLRLQPGANIHIDYLHPDQVKARVVEGIVDFGLVSFPRSSRELIAVPWREEEMVLACAPSHALGRAKSVRPSQLQGEKYIGFDRRLIIRKEVDRFLNEQGVKVEVALEFDNIENIKKAIEISAGVALLPLPTLRREVAAGSLLARPLAGCELARPLGIIHRRNPSFSPTARAFLAHLRQPLAAPRESDVGVFAGGSRRQAPAIESARGRAVRHPKKIG
jgi:DNA-binding transcriptional LysR family regulator